MRKIELCNGKYTVINDLGDGGGFKALRYGNEWRNLAGDNLILALFHEIEAQRAEIKRLQSKLDDAESLLTEAQDVMDDVHLGDSETFRSISEYFDGGDNK